RGLGGPDRVAGRQLQPHGVRLRHNDGLLRASRREIRENLRGLPMDSRYSPHAVVLGSSSQNCIRSLPETSARLPADSTVDRPTSRRLSDACKDTPRAADWLKMPSPPRRGSSGAMDALSETAGSVLASPREAGPTSRMPFALAWRTSARWSARPWTPSSANPAV